MKTASRTKAVRASLPATPFPPGVGIAGLETALRTVLREKAWDMRKPLPTTRELGGRYGVSNSSACRLLKRLDEEGVVWRQDNGRYFPPESRALVERRRPVACLLRKLQNWSQVYHDVMAGFTEAFGGRKGSMLFVHNDVLVQHSDTAHPPRHADPASQRAAIAEFLEDHNREFGGILIDEVWQDAVLDEFRGQLQNAVVVCRPTAVPGLSSVSVDFAASALIAVGHLYARGFEEIWVGIPFQHAVVVEAMVDAIVDAAARLGTPLAPENLRSVSTPDERDLFVAALQRTKRRVGVFCPEDNVSLLLAQALAAAGVPCPGRVGVLSGMGTRIVTDAGISSLHIDYVRIGRSAGEILLARDRRNVAFPADLSLGRTT